MKTYHLTAEVKVQVHIKVRAKSKAGALREAEELCQEFVPLFYHGSADYEKPKMVEVEGPAWIDPDSISDLFQWEIKK